MIKVEKISKKYVIPHEKKHTFFETMLSLIKDNHRYEEFYALKDVSFQIEKGEFIGVIGNNGSGKTTLLSILSRITKPSSGKLHIDGKVSPFLSMGIGFHPELTAKENIFLYGAIMGLERKRLKKKMNEILEFADVKNFADAKIKKFSSGMIVRLAFSTIIQTNPEILILDELFAVGDKDFAQKCLDVFKEYKKKGKTIILGTHNLGILEEYFDKVLLLDKGRVIKYGSPKEVVDYYKNF